MHYARGWQVSLALGQKLISPLDSGSEHSQRIIKNIILDIDIRYQKQRSASKVFQYA